MIQLLNSIYLTRKRKAQHDADLLRLLLLERYGGIWADVSVLPILPLDRWLEQILAPVGFWTYRFFKKDGYRDISQWFLSVSDPGHEFIKVWREYMQDRLLSDSDIPYFIGSILPYDHDIVEHVITGMPQVSEKIPHLCFKPIAEPFASRPRGIRNAERSIWDVPSYMYKRPNIDNLDIHKYKWYVKHGAPQKLGL